LVCAWPGFSLALVLVCTSISAWVVHESKVEFLAGQSADYLLSLAGAGSLLVGSRNVGGKELAEVHLDRGMPAEPEVDESAGVLLPSSSFGGVKPSIFLLRCLSGVGKSLELEMVRASVEEAGRHYYPGKTSVPGRSPCQSPAGSAFLNRALCRFRRAMDFAVVPVRDAGGRIAGLLQADLPAAWIHDTAMNAAAGVIKVGFWCVLGGLGLALLWGWRFEQRVRAMGLALTQIAASDFRRQILTEQPDELAGMSDSLNQMLELLKLSRDGLLFQSSRWKEHLKKPTKSTGPAASFWPR